VLHCSNAACTSGAATSLDTAGNVGVRTSITIGADGLGGVTYSTTNLYLKALHCNNLACTSGTAVTFSAGGMGEGSMSSSITMGADGHPLISYIDPSDNSLKVAKLLGLGQR